VSRPASEFVDGAPRLAARVREVDGIDSFFPSGSKDQCIKNIEFEFIKVKTGCHCVVNTKHTIMKSLLGSIKRSTGPPLGNSRAN